MFEIIGKKLCVRLLTLGTLIICLLVLTYRENLAQYMNTPQQQTVPEVSVKEQPDSPLLISVLTYNSSDPRTPEIIFLLTNRNIKPIRAYTIAQETSKGTNKSSSATFADMNSTTAMLQPGRYINDSITYEPLSEVTSRVTLAVDLVEFSDGTTWGPDTHKFTEHLAGRRAGAHEVSKHIIHAYKIGGLAAVHKLFEANSTDITPPSGHSERWEEGFRSGSSFLAHRLKRLLESGDASKSKAELRKLSEKLEGERGDAK